jgi:hypothetical protein
MSRSQTKQILRSTGCAVVVAVGLSIASVTSAVASPEDEIARLDRVRANLFEQLVKTRAELEAANRAREAAEAELARLKQEAASAKPAIPATSAETKAEPKPRATTAVSPTIRRQSAGPAASGTTGSVQRTVPASTQQRIVRSRPAPRAVTRRIDQAPHQSAAPVGRAQELPSVLRLQDPQ